MGAGKGADRAAGHSHALFVHRDSAVHALPPQVKIVASVLFTVAVVATPREALWAFAGYAGVVVVVAYTSGIGLRRLALRSLIELPFVLLAFALPFLGHGARVDWFGLSLSVDGLYGMWNIIAKGTLGVWSSLLLAGTTSPRDLLLGLDRLRCPTMVTQIATFMLRYLDVLSAEAGRMRVAQRSRGYDPRFLWQIKGFASGVGALFLRTFERGERVYLAMVSRGYDGRMPPARTGGPATAGQWIAAAWVPATAGAIATAALLR